MAYIINFLLTERKVFFVQTERVGRGLYKKTEVRYFSVHTEQARLIKSLLYRIYTHLYLKQTRNAWFEMHISSVVHIWSKKTKNTNVFLLFH
jgi:transcriptional regulator CtsR